MDNQDDVTAVPEELEIAWALQDRLAEVRTVTDDDMTEATEAATLLPQALAVKTFEQKVFGSSCRFNANIPNRFNSHVLECCYPVTRAWTTRTKETSLPFRTVPSKRLTCLACRGNILSFEEQVLADLRLFSWKSVYCKAFLPLPLLHSSQVTV